jgi:hypothetical protein
MTSKTDTYITINSWFRSSFSKENKTKYGSHGN